MHLREKVILQMDLRFQLVEEEEVTGRESEIEIEVVKGVIRRKVEMEVDVGLTKVDQGRE